MKLALLVLAASLACAGPIGFQPHNVYGPGYVTDLPWLLTFKDGPVDYSQCGEITILSTLENGAPDPNGSKWHLQLLTPCKQEHGWGEDWHDSHTGAHHGKEPVNVPEPGTWAAGIMAVLVICARRARG